MAVDRVVQELNEAFKQSGLINFLNTVSLVSEILRIFGLVNVICLPVSFQTGPLGLTRLVQRFTRKQDETAEQARKRFFRRIFGILWVRFLCCFYCMPCNFMTKTYNSAFNLPLFVDTWLWALFAVLAWHVWRVCSLVFIYCAIIFALVFTANDRLQDISFGDPSAIPWLFSIVVRAFIRNNLLYKIHHIWAQWSWGQFCFWTALSKFDLSSIRVLWITFRCQCQCIIQVFCPYYQSHTLLLYFLQQFGNKVGEDPFRGKAMPTYVYPESIKATIHALVSQDLRDFPNPETPTVRLAQYLRTLTPLPLRPHFPIIVFSLSDETFEILL